MDFNGINLFIGLKNAVYCIIIRIMSWSWVKTLQLSSPLWALDIGIDVFCLQQSKRYQDSESY